MSASAPPAAAAAAHAAGTVDELALLLAATEAVRTRARARIVALARRFEPGEIAACFGGHGMLALLGARLREAGAEVPPELARSVDGALAFGRRRAVLYGELTAGLSRALEGAGIPALALKGPGLAERVHGDPGARQSNDIDLLVSPADLGAALGLLERRGYALLPGSARTDRLPALHHALVDPAGERPSVDLHWHVHWCERRFSADMLARATVTGGVRVPDPHDELATILISYVKDGFTGLRYGADAAAWWDSRSGAGEQPPLDGLVLAYPELRRLLELSAAAIEHVSGLPRADLLRRPRALPAADRRVLRLANWPRSGSVSQVESNQALVALLASGRPDLRASVGRALLVEPLARIAAEAARTRTPPPRAAVRAALLLPVKRLGRFAYALWRVRSGRTWAPLPEAAAAALGHGRPDAPPARRRSGG